MASNLPAWLGNAQAAPLPEAADSISPLQMRGFRLSPRKPSGFGTPHAFTPTNAQDEASKSFRIAPSRLRNHHTRSYVMLSWAITFLVIALIAAVLGFGGIAGAATGIAKILFFAFLVLFLVSLVVPRLRGSV